MEVRKLNISGFRNIENIAVNPCPGVNILFGDNAQGKTNFLESIWLFTGSRSFRGAKDDGLVRIGSQTGFLKMDFFSSERENGAELRIDQSRHAALNGVKLESPSKLAGEFRCVIFSPEHLGLIKEGPQIRRKFLDGAICQLWPKHAALSANYSRALANRNALLKDVPRHSDLLDTIEIWDDRLASFGSQIVFARMRYLSGLLPIAVRIYDGISNGNESLSFSYRSGSGESYPFQKDDRTRSLSEIRCFLAEKFFQNRQADIESGFTRDGPHRDDLEIGIGGLSAKLFASQGQQRSAVLALKLAEAALIQEKTGEPPILLLDDVMSELDKKRQDYLLNHIVGWQVFITCCDPSVFSELVNGRIFEIENGKIKSIAGH